MAAEAWYDGTWNDWCWKTPDHWGSSSSSNPRAGWMWHDARQHSLWLPWNLPVDVTGNNPRQSGDERGEVIPLWDEIEASWKASLLDPREGESEEPSRAGRWRQQKGPDEPQSAVEDEKVKEYRPQKKR